MNTEQELNELMGLVQSLNAASSKSVMWERRDVIRSRLSDLLAERDAYLHALQSIKKRMNDHKTPFRARACELIIDAAIERKVSQ